MARIKAINPLVHLLKQNGVMQAYLCLQDSRLQPATHNAKLHNPQRTTHNPQPTTHNAKLTTHNPQPAFSRKTHRKLLHGLENLKHHAHRRLLGVDGLHEVRPIVIQHGPAFRLVNVEPLADDGCRSRRRADCP